MGLLFELIRNEVLMLFYIIDSYGVVVLENYEIDFISLFGEVIDYCVVILLIIFLFILLVGLYVFLVMFVYCVDVLIQVEGK